MGRFGRHRFWNWSYQTGPKQLKTLVIFEISMTTSIGHCTVNCLPNSHSTAHPHNLSIILINMFFLFFIAPFPCTQIDVKIKYWLEVDKTHVTNYFSASHVCVSQIPFQCPQKVHHWKPMNATECMLPQVEGVLYLPQSNAPDNVIDPLHSHHSPLATSTTFIFMGGVCCVKVVWLLCWGAYGVFGLWYPWVMRQSHRGVQMLQLVECLGVVGEKRGKTPHSPRPARSPLLSGLCVSSACSM
jgi:hypothetical protein